jgi:hypothetical protein
MSFIDGLGKIVGQFTQNNPQGVSDISGHLLASIPGLDDSAKASLGQHITDALAQQHGTDADSIAQQAGTSTDEVASGNEGALQKIIGMAQQHPEMLTAATQAFAERNPQALMQFAPAIMDMFKK